MESDRQLSGLLLLAVQEDNLDQVHSLLQQGADVNSESHHGETALCLACEVSSCEMVHLLLEHGACVNRQQIDGWPPLTIACYHERVDVASVLLSRDDVDVDLAEDVTALHMACISNNTELVKMLIEAGANVNAGLSKESALMIAIEQCHDEICSLLLGHGADIHHEGPDAASSTLLIAACNSLNWEMATTLVKLGVDVNAGACSALAIAADKEQWPLVKLLVSHGADVETKVFDTLPLLHFACDRQQIDLVKLLIQKGANVDACNRRQVSPLNIICRRMVAQQDDHD